MTNDLAIVEPEMATELPAAQMELILGDNRPIIDRTKGEFNHTAERLLRDRPDIYNAAIKLLAEPREAVPYRRICKRLHVSYHTLRQVEMRSEPTIAKIKQSLAAISLSVTERAAEETHECLRRQDYTDAKNVSVVGGIWGSKALEFAGEAIGKIEVHHKIDITAKIDNAYNKIMAEFKEMKRAQIVEVEPRGLPAS